MNNITQSEYAYLADKLDEWIEIDYDNLYPEEDVTLDWRRKLVLKLDYMAGNNANRTKR